MNKIQLKSPSDIEKLKESGKILSAVLKETSQQVREGVSLLELDKIARKIIKESGGTPVFLGYRPTGADEPYPAAICSSVNEVVVHGVPTDYKLKEGDIITVDAGVNYEGMITDSAVTIGVGNIDNKTQKLLKITKESLNKGIEACIKGGFVGDIGNAIEQFVKPTGFQIIKNLTGHGVGFNLHEEPTIFNYGKKGTGVEIQEGMVLAIEPMLSFSSEYVVQNKDGSYTTDDGSKSAHFEATIAITENGTEIISPIFI